MHKPLARYPKSLNDQGMVAITTTLIIMILITLVVSSFSLVVRREQRQSLDRQLSTQAFYAAESGVQDVTDALLGGVTIQPDWATDCDGFNDATNYNSVIEANVSYSCVLVNDAPESLEFTRLSAGRSVVIPVDSNRDEISISWQNADADAADRFVSGPGAFRLPRGNTALDASLLRVMIVPGFKNGPKSAGALLGDTKTAFLYPQEGAAGDISDLQYLDDSSQGQLLDGNCSTGRQHLNCEVRVRGLDSGNDYYLVVKPLYLDASLSINGAGTPTTFEGAQAVVDVTGKAEDVLRRIQVRIPVNPSQRNFGGILPEAALETVDSICKLLEVGSSEVRDDCASVSYPLNNPQPPAPEGPEGDGSLDPQDGFFFGQSLIQGAGGSGGGTGTGTDAGSGTGQIPQQRDYRWNFRIYNRSTANDPSTIAGCEWNMGDGTIISNRACLAGEYIDHRYREWPLPLDVPEECIGYSVVLTINFTNGITRVSSPVIANIPQGDLGRVECSGQYHSP